MKGFWSRPTEFSFKDLLAICFSGSFLFFCFWYLTDKEMLELVKTLIPVISVILGGYFGQEMVVAYMQGKNPNQVQYYNPYQFSYISPTTQEEVINEESDTRGTI
ncbi:MAG: hypothetical protein QJR05_08210 [Thermoanaerobacterium sp.]|nr:hypothetical protein [Thermoanaerobacterium sp.]